MYQEATFWNLNKRVQIVGVSLYFVVLPTCCCFSNPHPPPSPHSQCLPDQSPIRRAQMLRLPVCLVHPPHTRPTTISTMLTCIWKMADRRPPKCTRIPPVYRARLPHFPLLTFTQSRKNPHLVLSAIKVYIIIVNKVPWSNPCCYIVLCF